MQRKIFYKIYTLTAYMQRIFFGINYSDFSVCHFYAAKYFGLFFIMLCIYAVIP